jgi:predicted nucleic acid-binding protein
VATRPSLAGDSRRLEHPHTRWAFDALLGVVDEVLPVDGAVVERAKAIVLGKRQFSARDALHVAVMQHHGIARILSFDGGFDGIPGIQRVR